ncbi:hypothetical protein ACH495_30260 [Micromonospora sp. NPDC018662]|uniref:hypothetical protein n=1 Tax=Micromonospora sp. NPDC018662 TaxID=3364238 RepID=UPI00378AC217
MAAFAALILIMTVVGRPGEIEGRPLSWPDALVAGAAFVLVLVRRRWPLPVLAVSALLAATVAAGGQPPAVLVVTAVAAYTVAAHARQHAAWLAGRRGVRRRGVRRGRPPDRPGLARPAARHRRLDRHGHRDR